MESLLQVQLNYSLYFLEPIVLGIYVRLQRTFWTGQDLITKKYALGNRVSYLYK